MIVLTTIDIDTSAIKSVDILCNTFNELDSIVLLHSAIYLDSRDLLTVKYTGIISRNDRLIVDMDNTRSDDLFYFKVKNMILTYLRINKINEFLI